MSAATHLPWVRNEYGQVIGSNQRTVVVNGFASVMSPGVWQDEANANTAAVILAVNSHDELVAALKGLLKSHRPGRGQCCDEADAALDVLAKVEPRIPDVQIKGAA